jgi:hypothetical protein
MKNEPPTSRHLPLATGLLALGGLVLAGEAALFCRYGTSVYDEGGYLYEGWLAVAHGWMPFRDFFSRLPGLLTYVYGLGQALFGPSMAVGRLEAALFLFAGLGLAAWIAGRLAGPWASVLLVWLTAANPFALSNYLLASAIGPTTFFTVLALALLIVPRPRPAPLIGAAVAIAAMLLCRQDQLPLALMLWVYMLWQYPLPLRARVAAVLTSWLAFGLAMLPFVLAAPGNVLWTLTVGKLGAPLPYFPEYCRAEPFTAASLVWYCTMFLRHHAGLALLLIPALIAWPLGGAWPRRSSDAEVAWARVSSRAHPDAQPFWLLLATAAAGWLGYLPGILAIRGNVTYLLGFFLFWPIAIAAAALFTLLVRGLAPDSAAPRRALIVVAVLAVLMPVFTGPGPHFAFSRERPTTLERIQTGARALTAHIPPGATIFTVDDPHHFLQAGLILPPELTEQLFSYRDTPDTALLRRLHLYNDEMIREWLGGAAQYAVISAGSEQFMCGGRYAGGPRLSNLIKSLLQQNYDLIAVEPGSWGGPMRIYRRKPHH